MAEESTTKSGHVPEHDAAGLLAAVRMFTVPLFFFKGEAQVENYQCNGTAVLVKIRERFFALTAGHCIEEGRDGEIVMGVVEGRHTFKPTLARHARRGPRGSDRDFGFWEVPGPDAKTIQSMSRVFLAESRIEVLAAGDVAAKRDEMILAGYPKARLAVDALGRGAGLLAYNTCIAGVGGAPASTIARSYEEQQVIDLWVPKLGNQQTTPQVGPTTVPLLSGASGGGCWFAMGPIGPNWDPAKIRLAAIHAGSCEEVEVSGEKHVFTREILVGHHLRLIAEETPDLKEYMFEKWPQLAAFSVDGV